MKKHIFVIFFAFLLLLCACQPTPEEPFVIGKDNEAMIEKAKETGAPAPMDGNLYDALGAPRTCTVDLKSETAHVIVSGEARVVLPDTDRLPLAYVQAARFSQEQVYAFFNALTAGTEMYDIPNATPKWYFEEHIKEEQVRVDDLIARGNSDDAFRIQAMQENIQGMREAYLNAPEEVALVTNDGTLKPYSWEFMGKNRATGTSVYAVSQPFGEGGACFSVTNDADYENSGSYAETDQDGNEQSFVPRSGSTLSYTRNGVHMGFSSGCTLLLDVTRESETGAAAALPEGLILGGYLEPETLLLSLTPAEARQQAEALTANCGVTDMAVDGVYLLTDRQNVPAEWWEEDDLEELRAREEHQVYVVRFLRQLAGVPVESYYGISQVKLDNSGYGPEWMYEVLEVAVDDAGVQTVDWTGPLAVESVVTDRAALLSFSEIREIFEKMIPVIYANYGVDLDWQIEVTEMRLCLWRIFDKDSYTRGILAPVWCFYGYLNGERRSSFQPILILNAVDGSVIDPQQGY